MINKIKIPLKEFKLKNKLDYIDELSKVNIFVGANNSGKSRFLRSLCSNKIKFQSEKHSKIFQELIKFKEDYERYLKDKKPTLPEKDPLKIIAQIDSLEYIEKTEEITDFFHKLKDSIKQNLIAPKIHSDTFNSREIAEYVEMYIKNNKLEKLLQIDKLEYKFVYIPMLRGLRNLAHKKEESTQVESPFGNFDCYRDRTIFDYFNPERSVNTYLRDFKDEFEIFTGLKLYEDIQKMLLGNLEERNFIKNFQDFLSSKFFNDKPIALIPRIDSDVLYIKIGDEKERPIYDLGDGLQTIILISFPLFKYQKENLLLFVEEPESTLHPGMQRKILQTYCDEFPNSQIFLTTHSNHLLDLTLDFNGKVSIYSFNKIADENFEIKNISPNKEILDILGVRNSSVFLSNCIIWVEGVSDRLYIKKYLQLYYDKIKPKKKRPFEEDKHFTILEYGGGNITHFNFELESSDDKKINVSSISKNNLLIADKDDVKDYKTEISDDDSEKTKRLKLFYKILKKNFYAEHIEIENTIPCKIYKKYFEELRDNTKRKWEYDPSKLGEDKFNSDIKTKRIGEVLKEHFIRLKEDVDETPNMGFKANDISCIGNKKDTALELIQTMDKKNLKFDELSKETQNLVKRIYDFIEANNS